jgi:hypothetical protein
MMNAGQLELGFANGGARRSIEPRHRRLKRANWWFERMREVVDRAFDWHPAPMGRPEQIWFESGQIHVRSR